MSEADHRADPELSVCPIRGACESRAQLSQPLSFFVCVWSSIFVASSHHRPIEMLMLTDAVLSCVCTGSLRYIRNLKPWPLKRVMVEKYLWSEADSQALCDFLEPMLVIDHRQRRHARDLVDHKWLEVDPLSEDLWGW